VLEVVAVAVKPVIGAPLAPIVNEVVAPPAKFTVVAVVLIRANVVLGVVIEVVIAGLVANNNTPVPVSSVIADAKFAEEGVAKKVATPVPNPETPVEIGRPVQLVNVPEDGVPRTGVVRVGLVRVLLVNVSAPARVAKVPVVGSVTLVVAVAVRVVLNAPEVARVEPSTRVRVEPVAGAVIDTLFILVAVATPIVGVVRVGLVRVLFVRVSVPANVARVPVVGRVTLVVAVAVRVVLNAPAVTKVEPLTNVNVPVVVDTVKPLMLVAVATPNAGVVRVGLVNVLFVRVSAPVRVAYVLVSNAQEFAPVFFKNPLVPVSAPMAVKSASPA
jgi:hypothetical protein